MGTMFGTLILVALALAVFLAPRTRPSVPECVVVEEAGVRHMRADGTVEYVAWRNLVAVEIVTTDDGPIVEDVFFLLHARDGGGCVVPHALSDELLPRLQALPGFDNVQVIRAMGSTQNARFVCWRAAS
jgi:hypothetical protein